MSRSEALVDADRVQQAPLLTWTEPDGIAVRGTLVVIPGRGEQPAHYERFGRRISADGYRVHAVTDPTVDAELTASQVADQLAGPAPRVLVGSDTGALFAAGLAASGQVPGLDAIVLAGLPTAYAGLPAAQAVQAVPDGRLVGRGARQPDRMPHPPRAPVGSGPSPRRAVRAHPRRLDGAG